MEHLLWLLLLAAEAVELPGPGALFNSYQDVLRVPYQEWRETSVVVVAADGAGPLLIQEDALVLGAANAVLRLNATSLAELSRLRWPPDDRKAAYCRMNGQTEEECQNYVRTLAMSEGKLLACGSHAFAPSCRFLRPDEVSKPIGAPFDGVGLVPYSPNYSHSYLISKEGGFYSGTTTDFSGHDASLLRVLPKDRLLTSPKSGWLRDPTFISAHEVGNFVFFFFRETAAELSPCGSPEVGRVGRVCKNDIGGDVVLDRTWTTFNKATLNCSSLHRLQSVSVDEDSGLVYAAFTSQDWEVSTSAVCAYSLDSFRASFGGDYLYQESNAAWTRHPNSIRYFDCGVKGPQSGRPGQTERSLAEAHKYQLMADPVQPLHPSPLTSAHLERYSHLLVDTVRMKHYGRVHVLFVITREGLLKKYSLLPEPVVKGSGKGSLKDAKVSCLVEVVQLSPPRDANATTDPPPFLAKDAKLHSQSGYLYISSNNGIIKTPLHRCGRFKTRQTCLDAMDPYCGWDSKERRCSAAPGGLTTHHFWHQDVAACPNTLFPLDGGWSEWSAWDACPLMSGLSGELCQCRRRDCNRPVPARGGLECTGPSLQVTNCTRHGEWSDWSAWSGCSASCGIAVRSRSRACANPAPSFDGRVCLGPEAEQEYCPMPDCPEPTPAPVHGGWSLWSAWDSCSRKCGGGLSKRTRACNSPRPANEGLHCFGCHIEYKECNTEPCEEVRRWSEWTDWLQSNSSGGVSAGKGVWLKRYKFACSVRTHDPALLGVSAPRAEDKFCRKDTNDCTDTVFRSVDGGWARWGAWSGCGSDCGGGVRSRTRTCTNPAPMGSGHDCPGHGKEQEECNTHPCQAEWSCWSPWEECSASCGSGVEHRVRACDTLPGQETCKGPRVESRPCQRGPCTADGYGDWSGWSACSELDVSVRIRPCVSPSFCGNLPDAQMRRCDPNTLADAQMSRVEENGALLGIILGVVGAFLGGVAVTLALLCILLRRRWKGGGSSVPSTVASSDAASDKSANLYSAIPLHSRDEGPPHLTINPLLSAPPTSSASPSPGLPPDVPYDVYGDMDGSHTLKRTLRTSLKDRDYL